MVVVVHYNVVLSLTVFLTIEDHGLVFGMCLLVTFKIEVCIEHFTAVIAGESLLASMDFHMLVQICSLSEAETTIWLGTHIGSLISVNAQMVKEIVPLSEPFVAAIVIAFEYSNVSLGLRVFICEDTVLFSCRYMLLDLHRP